MGPWEQVKTTRDGQILHFTRFAQVCTCAVCLFVCLCFDKHKRGLAVCGSKTASASLRGAMGVARGGGAAGRSAILSMSRHRMHSLRGLVKARPRACVGPAHVAMRHPWSAADTRSRLPGLQFRFACTICGAGSHDTADCTFEVEGMEGVGEMDDWMRAKEEYLRLTAQVVARRKLGAQGLAQSDRMREQTTSREPELEQRLLHRAELQRKQEERYRYLSPSPPLLPPNGCVHRHCPLRWVRGAQPFRARLFFRRFCFPNPSGFVFSVAQRNCPYCPKSVRLRPDTPHSFCCATCWFAICVLLGPLVQAWHAICALLCMLF